MAEEKEEGIKITDRRKFNPDGTPRDLADEAEQALPNSAAPNSAEPVSTDSTSAESDSAEPAASETEEPQDRSDAATETDNVVSFPGASQSGASQSGAAATAQTGKAPNPAAASAERAYNQTSQSQTSTLPQASFVSLINMLGVEAAMHLGLIESPGGGAQVDIEAARHMIDLLGIIEQKTRGNLSPEEDNLLENVLADLRMQYVMRSKRK